MTPLLGSSADLLDRLHDVAAAVAAGERAAGWDLAELVATVEEQITSGSLVLTWDATVTGADGLAVDATITQEGDRVIVEVDTLVEEDGGAFAIDLDALAAEPVFAPPPVVPRTPAPPEAVDLDTIIYPTEQNGATLRSVKAWLAAHKLTGTNCPACGRVAKLENRNLNSGQAASLIRMYRAGGPDGMAWLHIPSRIGALSREEGKLKHWGLLESQIDVLGKDGRRGVWRLTPSGVDFVLGEGTVPKAIRMYCTEFLGTTGRQITILDAIGTKFDYAKRMHG